MSATNGILVVVSGPSGVGKTTVVDELLTTPGYARAVTATTRAPREGEIDGTDYLFLSREEFLAGVERGEFLEHAVVYGYLYGTPRRHVEEIVERGEVCILNVDVQGGAEVRKQREDAFLVFITAPSVAELERRLRGRGTEDEEVVARRLAAARRELERRDEYDVTVVNDDLDRTIGEIRSRVEARRRDERP